MGLLVAKNSSGRLGSFVGGPILRGSLKKGKKRNSGKRVGTIQNNL